MIYQIDVILTEISKMFGIFGNTKISFPLHRDFYPFKLLAPSDWGSNLQPDILLTETA